MMEGTIFAIFVIVSIIVSIVQRVRESGQASKRQSQPREPGLSPEAEKLPESTRRILFGPPRGHEGAPAGRQETRQPPPVPTARDIFDALVGKQTDEEEGEWKPLVEPPPRRELPRQIQQAPPRPQPPRRQVQREVVTRPAPQQQPVRRPAPPQATQPPPAQQRRPAQAVSKAPQRPARPKTRPQRRVAAQSRKKRTRIFDTLDDIRRGIILSEILGTPKGLQEL